MSHGTADDVHSPDRELLVGGAVLAIIAAIVYGVTQEGSLGTVGLISAALALAFLAGVNMYTRDADVSAMDPAR